EPAFDTILPELLPDSEIFFGLRTSEHRVALSSVSDFHPDSVRFTDFDSWKCFAEGRLLWIGETGFSVGDEPRKITHSSHLINGQPTACHFNFAG
ncbi:MAG: hypothetical protein ACPGXX_18015, partial [Planctomycetaceae bacterium]